MLNNINFLLNYSVCNPTNRIDKDWCFLLE